MINFSKETVIGKLIVLLVMSQCLALALFLIDNVNEQRGASRAEAAAELQTTYVGPQTVVGPMLVVPYIERWSEAQRDSAGKIVGQQERAKSMVHVVFPDRLGIEGDMKPEARYRGVFSIPFYAWNASFEGLFPAFDRAEVAASESQSTLEFLPPYVALRVSDVRGIEGSPTLDVGGSSLRFQQRLPGVAPGAALADGLHAPLAGAALAAWQERRPMPFKLQFGLVGQGRLAMVPIGEETTAHIRSSWASPSFGGRFLASERSVGPKGFDATWRVSSLVSSARAEVRAGLVAPVASSGSTGSTGSIAPSGFAPQSFDVSLVEPLNIYAMSTRAGKYGMLFIVLVLMAAFMFELFRDLRLHLVQYGLVGVSIVLFFLLLLALSEKVAFGIAYLGAAGASVLLLAAYFRAVLKSVGRGVSFATYVAVLYAALYGLLASESNALLLGSMLVFGMVAVLMIGTRHVDWYALGTAPGDAPRTAALIETPATAA